MNIICIYLIYIFLSQAYMFKYNVNTARKNAYPISLSDYIAYLNVLHIYIFWTSLRTCVIAYAWIPACEFAIVASDGVEHYKQWKSKDGGKAALASDYFLVQIYPLRYQNK